MYSSFFLPAFFPLPLVVVVVVVVVVVGMCEHLA
jgi:hypothetical protein